MVQIVRWILAAIAFAAVAGCAGSKSVAGLFPVTHGKWTVLVYMNAANDLDTFSTLNVNQMEQVATNPDVRFVVQWKQATSVTPTATFNSTRRYLIKADLSGNVRSQVLQDMGPNVDMGVPQTLNDFLKWGMARYPADHTVVILWDHGNGWQPKMRRPKGAPAFSYDDATGHAIQTWELNQAFNGVHVDIAAFDCSLMQMDEVAYQLIGLTDFVAGSEESPPGAGYPYQRVLGEFTNNPDQSPRLLAKAFVDGMLNEPTYATQKIEQSVVDTSQMAGVAAAASSLQQALVANAAAIDPIIPTVRSNTQAYSQRIDRFYFDSVDLCNQISASTSITAVQNACVSYNAAVASAVVWEGHNALSPGSHGLSIDFSPSSYFSTVSTDYSKLAWNTASGWSQWLLIAP